METDRSRPRFPLSRTRLLVLVLLVLAAVGIAGAQVTFDQDFVTTPQLNPDGQQLDLNGDLNISNNAVTALDELVFGSGEATVTQDAAGETILVEGDTSSNIRVNLLELDPDGSPTATIYGNLDLDNSLLTNVGSLDCPVDEVLFGDGSCGDVIESADDLSDTYVNKSGDNMTGTLDMNDSSLLGLPNPSGSTEAVNKGWLETNFLGRQGADSMAGNLDMAGNDLLNLANVTVNGTMGITGGDLGIGTATPDSALDINGSVDIRGDLDLNGNNLTAAQMASLQTSTLPACDSGREGNIRYNGTAHYGCDGSSWNRMY